MPFGTAAAEALVKYHQALGGVSRHIKIHHFVTEILGQTDNAALVKSLLEAFAAESGRLMRAAAKAEWLIDLLATLKADGKRLFVVSGTEEGELRQVLAHQGIAEYFDAIHGSPQDKDTILADLAASGALARPGLFLGDARYDHEAACRAGLEFVFLSEWTEFADWRAYFDRHPTAEIHGRLAELLEDIS